MSYIADNLTRIRERIARAAQKSGRRPEEIVLVAVTKTITVARIREAISAGATDLGENYVQEALPKIEEIGHPVRWHLIGHLQTNKARFASHFDLIQTVDNLKVARALSRHALALGRTLEVLIEVNISREPQKFGVRPEAAADLVANISELAGLKVSGLMGMAPYTENPEENRPYFIEMKEIFDSLPNSNQRILSMGMTGDFEVAIEEGASMVRVGTGIFGPRS